MNTVSTFNFELSPAELAWLGGAFGHRRLPLPGPLPADEASRRAAQDALQARRLIRRVPGQGWQVDRLPAALVSWMAAAGRTLDVEAHTRAGGLRRARCFCKGQAQLWVAWDDAGYHFDILPDLAALGNFLPGWLGGSAPEPAPDPVQYVFPQPLVILPAAWTDAARAGRMLAAAGLPSGETPALQAWAETLAWIAAFTPLALEGEAPQAGTQTFLCGGRRGVWLGNAEAAAEESVRFTPLHPAEIHTALRNLM
jgi:hypothetical protein